MDPMDPINARKMFIIEDEEAVRTVLEKILSKDFEVESAPDGKEALEKFTPGQCDVALVDLVLPRLSGDQVVQKMKQKDGCFYTKVRKP